MGSWSTSFLATVYVTHITFVSSLLYGQVTSKQHEAQLFLEANSRLSFQEIFTLHGTWNSLSHNTRKWSVSPKAAESMFHHNILTLRFILIRFQPCHGPEGLLLCRFRFHTKQHFICGKNKQWHSDRVFSEYFGVNVRSVPQIFYFYSFFYHLRFKY